MLFIGLAFWSRVFDSSIDEAITKTATIIMSS